MSRYAEASCHEHGEDQMWYDEGLSEWVCQDCEDEDVLNLEAYNYGRN